MKRTYVDIIGEYYDNSDDLFDQAAAFGVTDAEIKRLFKTKIKARKFRLQGK